ncbi:RNA ligase [Actinoplanes oblitus]|uniref:RNA ligase n=1 Tax=Actinoplanes oblitus TaxID=3040509 RepID=A0ABY8WGZ1_9ACTN|nr:RNA ligase [Actinoplanes oblitus]WIM95624.1 RNA ligase [Actinoplanes oblitus]
MTLLHDVVDPVMLAEAVGNGLIRTQRHPRLPFTIYNYTEACQYSGAWTPVTLACRGLIVDAAGRVAARPLRKFFNHTEPQAPALDATAKVTVTDKADGSLGVIYHDGSGYAVATRGSFASDQAIHATDMLRTRYPSFVPPAGLTVLVEIIYPGNRIVVDYRGLDDLVLLGAVEIVTGRSHGPDAVPGWPGPVVETFGYATLAEALAAPPRDGREGLVVHFTDADQRVKIKYPDYVRLHRLVTGLTPRTVWAVLATGGDLDVLLEPLPDEFHAWARGVAAELTAEVDARAAAVEAAFAEIVGGLPDGWGRKEFALAAVRSPHRGELFQRLDGHDYRPGLWQRVRPSADRPAAGGAGE